MIKILDKTNMIIGLIVLFLLISGLYFWKVVYEDYENNIITNPEVVIEEKKEDTSTSFMISKLNPKLDKEVIIIITKSIEKYSKKYSLSIPLVVSLMYRESSFNVLSISKAKCIGLMQINPKAHPEKVKPYKNYELYHIDVNVGIGCQILKQYLDKKKTIKGALESYLGANNKGYMMDVLSTCVELSIKN